MARAAPDVGRRLHEAERHQIDAERQPERQVLAVLERERTRRQRHARGVDALVLAERAAVHHARADGRRRRCPPPPARCGRRRAAADRRRARRGPARRRWSRRGRRRPTKSPVAIVERIAFPQGQRLPAGQTAGADLRPAQVLHDRDVPADAGRGGPGALVGAAVRLVGAVREVEPHDVDAGGEQRVECGVVVGRRTERGDDLGVSHEAHSLLRRQRAAPAVYNLRTPRHDSDHAAGRGRVSRQSVGRAARGADAHPRRGPRPRRPRRRSVERRAAARPGAGDGRDARARDRHGHRLLDAVDGRGPAADRACSSRSSATRRGRPPRAPTWRRPASTTAST